MTNSDIETGIRKAFAAAAPDIKNEILSDLDHKKKGKVLKMPQTTKKTNHFWLRAAAVAAALLLIAGAGLAIKKLAPASTNAVFASVMIDVNPSIELEVNSDDKVVSAVPRNDDGAAVLDGMDLSGSDVEVAVNAIIGSMVRAGYLNELANSILITVSSEDASFEYRLRDALGADVRDMMESGEFGYAVLSQTLTPDPDTDALAEAYGMTRSKAQLIRRLIASNPTYAFSDLAVLSINELGLLSGSNAVEDLREYGHSSDRAYIGEEAALAIALEHAGVTNAEASHIEAELDCDHGRMIYDVEFEANGMEYDYDIDAVTGEVIKAESEPDDDHAAPTAPSAQPTAAPASPDATQSPSGGETVISSEMALTIALEHAGVKKSEAKCIEVELGRDDGKLIYDVEFKAGKTEYDYEIDAVTGKILDHDSETDDDHHSHTPKPTQKPSDPSPKPTQNIGREAALEIALKDAKVSADDAKNVEAELKTKRGVKVYEVEFDAGKYEYDYVINAKTGEIIERSREHDDDHDGGHNDDHGSSSSGLIGEAKAWEIALTKAGLKMSEISDKEIELDTENGVRCYELEFKSKGYEYEVKINAATGAIMKFDKERDS